VPAEALIGGGRHGATDMEDLGASWSARCSWRRWEAGNDRGNQGRGEREVGANIEKRENTDEKEVTCAVRFLWEELR
jgi:hypothetical protein